MKLMYFIKFFEITFSNMDRWQFIGSCNLFYDYFKVISLKLSFPKEVRELKTFFTLQ